MAFGHKTEHRLRMRAQVVLHAARGRSNARIARETGLHRSSAPRWRSARLAADSERRHPEEGQRNVPW
ncbi:helix-turn-helix domain-containing protein [Kitasatospora sp. NPDC051984]|uniref:helix-turn-helix domain-containing protein n=1 Tax=Kitasatospora sp. NPDC051984 TaxID=3364059 RepID=UPI0037CC9D9A